MYKVEVKLDKSTLPEDGRKVRYETYEQYDIEGIVDAEEGLVYDEEGNFTHFYFIYSWEYID